MSPATAHCMPSDDALSEGALGSPSSKLARPVTLTRVAPAQRLLANAIACMEMPLLTGLTHFYATLRLSTTLSPRRFTPCCMVSLGVAGHAFELYLDADILAEQSDRYVPVAHLDTVPQKLRAGLLEAALDTPLEALEHFIGSPITVTAVATCSAVPALEKGFFVASEDLIASGLAYIAGEDKSFAWLLDMLRKLPKRPPNHTRALSVTARFELGASNVPLDQLVGLTHGDLILINQALPLQSATALRVRVDPLWSWPAALEPDGVRITHPLETIVAQHDQTAAEPIDLGKVDITLHFDLGETQISVAELEKLGPGYLFELTTQPHRPVTIRAGTQHIGTGELVQVNDRLGVRVLALSESFDGKHP